jgi:peroxiredoxin
MAQLRLDHAKFVEKDIVILVVGPEPASAFKLFWKLHQFPFIGLPDPKGNVLKLYGQEVKIFKFGRMPAQLLIDMDGIVRFVHYGQAMYDISENEEILELVSQLNKERASSV